MEKLKLIYDIKSIPEGLNIDNLFNIMNNSGIVVWDSNFNGKKPEIIDTENLTLYDVGFLSKELFEEKFNNLLEE